MSEQTLKRMLVALGVLVLAWIAATVVGGGPPEPGESGGEMADFLAALTPQSATTVTFAGGGEDEVRLQRETGTTGWRVAGHPADSARVARFLTGLDSATTGPPVSVNPANHPRMGVDEASARVLVLEGPEGADTLLVGEAGPSTGTAYARLPGRDEVHVVGADLSSHARRAPGDWRSRLMAAVDTASVTAVEVERDGSSYLLERGDSAWTVDGADADASAVRSLLGELARLEAQGFPGPDAGEPPGDTTEAAAAPGEPGAGEADRTVRVRGSGGEELLVLRMWEPGEEGGTDLEAVAGGPAARQPDAPFNLPSWRGDRLAPEPEAVGAGGG